jgi:trimeric autotransporter adhesin
MKNGSTVLATIVIVLVFSAPAPVAQATPPPKPEDRGNGNSAAENVQALNLSTTGSDNTAHGWFSLFSNTSGSANTADGFQALYSNTDGGDNTAYGFQALYSNAGSFDSEAGSFNTALGYQALYSNSGDIFHHLQGSFNTAVGYQALYSNTIGQEQGAGSLSTAVGYQALYSNTTAGGNTAIGYQALHSNTTSDGNTAVGEFALANTTGYSNTAMGDVALGENSTGANNTAIGHVALERCTTGSRNTALGENGGYNVTTANNVICIGSEVHGDNVDNSTWIGNIYGVTTLSGTTAPVVVSDTGQLGTVTSSERFKKDIRTIQNASEAILSLRPVSFHYKSDAKNIPHFGLIAEEVAKVNPALVVLDKDGKPYTVRYDQVNAMLLNEFLKEHRKVEEQGATIAELKKEIASITTTMKTQDAKIQKVSAQVELNKPAGQMVVNNP